MGLHLSLRRLWRGLRAIIGIYNAGRLFSGVLDMFDRLDH
jgi:hypothetical protein